MATTATTLGQIIPLRTVRDARGALTFFEPKQDLPFEVRRVYYIHAVPPGAARGGHAHKALERLIVAMHGSIRITLDDGTRRQTLTLDRPDAGLLLGPRLWIELEEFAHEAVCCVFASAEYDENDYIRDYAAFGAWVHRG